MQNTFSANIQIRYTEKARHLYGATGLNQATPLAAGCDLRAHIGQEYLIIPNERTLIPTGIFLAMPQGIMGCIYSRSGLGVKHGIVVTQGVGIIDADYRGEIFVAIHNIAQEEYTITPGERIAQIIFQPAITPIFSEVSALETTERGSGAFGHTGHI